MILDPHAPLTWATKQHFVQNPSRYDTLKSLAGTCGDEGYIDGDSMVTSGTGEGKDCGGSRYEHSAVFSLYIYAPSVL